MFSDKTRKYHLARSKKDFLTLFGKQQYYVRKFIFDEVIFVRSETDLLAFKNKCPHQGAKLNGCWIEQERVVCPLHQYKFDINNGRGHGLYLENYKLEENKDGFFLLRTYFSWFGE